MSVSKNWRNRHFYDLRPGHVGWSSKVKNPRSRDLLGTELNPTLTLAQLMELNRDQQEAVHRNMEEGAFAQIRGRRK